LTSSQVNLKTGLILLRPLCVLLLLRCCAINKTQKTSQLLMRVTIREEKLEDAVAVRRVNEEAFGQSQEARLVDLLRANKAVLLSLIAAIDDRIVGHILFSPVRIESEAGDIEGAGLGPMAVLPEFQRMGIGSKLIAEGTRRLQELDCPFIVVLGHPEYYPRFGFIPASRHGIRCQWEVPDEAFMLLPLDISRLTALSGLAWYCEEFAVVT
jgi:putative acetyltransferase